jgi:hypothetical protein
VSAFFVRRCGSSGPKQQRRHIHIRHVELIASQNCGGHNAVALGVDGIRVTSGFDVDIDPEGEGAVLNEV